MKKKKFEDFVIDEEMIQIEANAVVERNLNKKELDQVSDEMYKNLFMFLQDQIHNVIDYNEMMDRNKNADSANPRYEVFWRNPNAFRNNFEKSGSFKSLEDAKKYIHSDFLSPDDHWKVILINGELEEEVYKVN